METLGEAYNRDTNFADSLEAFGGGQDDPVSVSIGGPVMSKFIAVFRELASYKELLRSQVEHVLIDRMSQFFLSVDVQDAKVSRQRFDKAIQAYDQAQDKCSSLKKSTWDDVVANLEELQESFFTPPSMTVMTPAPIYQEDEEMLVPHSDLVMLKSSVWVTSHALVFYAAWTHASSRGLLVMLMAGCAPVATLLLVLLTAAFFFGWNLRDFKVGNEEVGLIHVLVDKCEMMKVFGQWDEEFTWVGLKYTYRL